MQEVALTSGTKFDRLKMEDTLKRRFFYDQSFALYGGEYDQMKLIMSAITSGGLLRLRRSMLALCARGLFLTDHVKPSL